MFLTTGFILVIAVQTICEGAVVTSAAGTCKNSFDCGAGHCCRNAQGNVITDAEMGGFGHHFFGDGQENGTCATGLAQKGELCDTTCQCATGLACYRPMSGVCCPPMTCYDEAYVKQQQAYWANCLANPQCAIPP